MKNNTITIAPDADFHLFVSAGASVYFWIAGALFIALLVWIWMLHEAAKRQDAETEKKEEKK